MIDIDKWTIPFECPRCGFDNDVFLKQMRLGDIVICRGCKINIHLRREKGALYKARRQVAELERTFKELEQNLTIKF